VSTTAPDGLDPEEQIARIRRMREESENFSAKQHKLTAEALKLERDRAIIPWQVVATLLGAGAALFAAGAGFVKVIGG
jgi:hypothetical protein